MKDIREDLERAREVLTNMLDNEPGTIRKDRHTLAKTFQDIGRVLETKSIDNTDFAPAHA